MNNYACDEPIEIKLFCECGKVTLTYADAFISYSDGTTEEAHKASQKTKGKEYWGNSHSRQISNFYRACLGLEALEIDGSEALKTHRLICELYDKGGMKNQL